MKKTNPNKKLTLWIVIELGVSFLLALIFGFLIKNYLATIIVVLFALNSIVKTIFIALSKSN
jgi:hypothetical protein